MGTIYKCFIISILFLLPTGLMAANVENLDFVDYESIEKSFVKKELHPLDLKNAVAREISVLLSKIDKKKLNDLGKKAY